jgi:hypothetical protein
MPSAQVISEELAWFEHISAPVLGTLILDLVDGDCGGIVLGRDEHNRFRCVDVTGWDETPEIAEMKLLSHLEEWGRRPAEDRAQMDTRRVPLNVFQPTVDVRRMNDAFVRLLDNEGFSPARALIESMIPYFEDIDGNFVEQFQSTSFDARFWELYLFALLTECGFMFDRTFAAPDFICGGVHQHIFVEAVTVNPSRNGNVITEPPIPEERTQLADYLKHYMPIKWGSPLVSKLRKEYWKLPHAKDKPIVLAIQDFHAPRAMTITNSTLVPYLYGLEFSAFYDADGRLQVQGNRIYEHKWNDKRIESGFFYLDGSEHISAVIQNPTATISKFNRMGYLAGLGSRDVRMLRMGTAYNSEPEAAVPVGYVHDVTDADYSETWSEGLNVFHNPNARHPLHPELFAQCMNHRLDGNRIVHTVPAFHPYTAETLIISPDRIEE